MTKDKTIKKIIEFQDINVGKNDHTDAGCFGYPNTGFFHIVSGLGGTKYVCVTDVKVIYLDSDSIDEAEDYKEFKDGISPEFVLNLVDRII